MTDAPCSPRPSPAQCVATLHTIAAAVSLLERQGIGAEVLLAGSGVSEGDLRQPSGLVTHAQELIVFANALQACGDTRIGLDIGRAMHISSYGILGYAMLVSPTLGDALQCAQDFPLLLGSYFKVSLRRNADVAAIVAADYRYRPDLAVINTDMCLASMWAVVCDVLSARRAPSALEVTFGAPAHADAYEERIGQRATFDAAENALIFPASWLDEPLPLAEPVSYLMSRQQCAQLEREWATAAGNDVTARSLRLLYSDPRRYGSLRSLADALCVSERTLRRRLAGSGSAFQALLDRVRHDLALDYLVRTRLSMSDIAERLGYSETAGFRHAFRRWTGRCPSDYRCA
ncbi:putative HTH-type transcriptional regulator [Paraburkholderia aspalathi]|jgi:AraC-like DNA-binding protein|uniref:HTH-type transcriptional regulator n=1 Tax=Paraburkholderia aspalathi TaxID=1324617 RepID=A0ABM8RHG1_9BURK|nr:MULTISPECIES: AraC family transcriptional regulator [Paraburkholderia]MBK3819398.1 AraC family transcriptional regulator [Paraburkholderia aspalathi]MBK3831228.1 AraC family transcriptional regulator [Paraburkholderia aspalathi]MBK3860933.1 AraC family transcriptional regulator [Paraburkholderia aspalathi]MCX4138947.1 AraC family transcriptional regulator [Paraburkholderia aspalathi]MDN7171637.1 AraC family transcriptional regulator [Paraburkholderia sp. SEWSISQ10-3 4]